MDLIETYRNAAQDLHDAIMKTNDRVGELGELIKLSDHEEGDLLHLIEMESFNAFQGYDLSDQLKKTRLRRRKYKDEYEYLTQVRKTFKNNYKLELHTHSIIESLAKTDSKMETRGYRMRTRFDLQQRVDVAREKKMALIQQEKEVLTNEDSNLR